jgi:hypothetical protein
MKRGSIIGPVLLIAVGALFLVNNLRPDLPALAIVSRWWPFVLVAWGLARIVEITYWWRSGRPVPGSGVSGGEWTLAAILCVVGSMMHYGPRFGDRFSRVRVGGLEMLGESYEYPEPEKKLSAGKAPRVVVENLRGNARIVGADTEEVVARGKTTVRAFVQSEADRVAKDCQPEVLLQGGVVLVRSNQQKHVGSSRVTTEMEITVPRGATVEARGRYGDFEVSGIAGSVIVDSDNAGVRLSNIGGNANVETRRGDVVRVVGVKGNVEVRGSNGDVELENIEGQALVTGSYGGELTFRRIAKALRFESSNTDLRVPRVPGRIELARGHLSGEDLVGPIHLRARSKDVLLTDFTDSIELDLNKGDVELRPRRLPLSKMNVTIKGGNVDLDLPEGAKFEINASVDRGEISSSEFGGLRQDHSGRGARLNGSVGGGPLITLHTDRGSIAVRKGGAPVAEPPAPPTPPIQVERQ